METLKFIYNEQTINFLPSGADNVMVNATEMAKIFEREIKEFNKLESTKQFIEICLNGDFKSPLSVVKKEDLIVSNPKTGTWMHRILALKFAAWLDPKFEVWVFTTIDTIILGYYKEQKDAAIEKIKAEKELQQKKDELLAKYPEFETFLELEEKVTDADRKRIKAIKASMAQLRLDF